MKKTKSPLSVKRQKNALGLLGALIFALFGGLLWIGLYQVGYFTSLSGLVTGIACVKGYCLFSKGSGKKSVIIASVLSVTVISAAWYLCLSGDVLEAYESWYSQGKIDYTVTFAQSFASAYRFLSTPAVARTYFADLVVGIVLAVMGSVGMYIRDLGAIKKRSHNGNSEKTED